MCTHAAWSPAGNLHVTNPNLSSIVPEPHQYNAVGDDRVLMNPVGHASDPCDATCGQSERREFAGPVRTNNDQIVGDRGRGPNRESKFRLPLKPGSPSTRLTGLSGVGTVLAPMAPTTPMFFPRTDLFGFHNGRPAHYSLNCRRIERAKRLASRPFSRRRGPIGLMACQDTTRCYAICTGNDSPLRHVGNYIKRHLFRKPTDWGEFA